MFTYYLLVNRFDLRLTPHRLHCLIIYCRECVFIDFQSKVQTLACLCLFLKLPAFSFDFTAKKLFCLPTTVAVEAAMVVGAALAVEAAMAVEDALAVEAVGVALA